MTDRAEKAFKTRRRGARSLSARRPWLRNGLLVLPLVLIPVSSTLLHARPIQTLLIHASVAVPEPSATTQEDATTDSSDDPAPDTSETLEIGQLETRYDEDPSPENARTLAQAYLSMGDSAAALAISTELLGPDAIGADHLLVARSSLAEANRRTAAGERSSFLGSLFADAEHQSRIATEDSETADSAAAFLAFVLFRLDRKEESLVELDQLIARTPQHAEGRALRGYLRLEMGEAKKALEDLEIAIEHSPKRPDVRVHYARALVADSPEAAAQALGEVIERELTDESFAKDVYEVLGSRADLAVQTLSRLTRARPEDPNSWYWLGRAQSDAALNAAAEDSYTRALEFAPGDPVVLAYRAATREKKKDVDGMVEDLIAVSLTDADIGERDWAIRKLQETTYWYATNGAWPDVVRLSRSLLAAIPDDPSSHGNLAIALMRLGKVNEAEEIFSDAIESFPANQRLQNDLGILLEGMGRQSEAKASFREAGILGSLDGKENLAIMLIDEVSSRLENPEDPDLERAEALLREVLAAAPDRVRSLTALERARQHRRGSSR